MEEKTYIYHHCEIGIEDDNLHTNKTTNYDSFEIPFQIINSKYP